MKKLASIASVLAFVLAFVLPTVAQTPNPPPETEEPEVSQEKPRSSMRDRFFVGGGVGAAFGAVDYVEVAPLVGFHVVPRVDLGVQPFYRWTNDDRYSPSISTTDYGSRLFVRVRIVSSFFAEADYQFTSYEYVDAFGGTTRASNNAFLAGGGYVVALGGNAGLYFSALYDFSYDDNSYYPYDSPVQLQFGVSVGF